MADFSQPAGQQDPDAVRKAILLALMGQKPDPGMPTPATPGMMPPQTGGPPAAPTTFAAPTVAAPANDGTQPGPQPARPLNGARPATAAPGGITRSASISDPEATNANNHPPPSLSPIMSESEYGAQHPLLAHTPYTPPDLKHRLFEGLFAGLQEFGRRGEGAATVRDYLGNIQKNEDAEANYPAKAAADAHSNYMTYAAGAKAPIDLENLNAEITDRQATARLKNAQAVAAGNPPPKVQHLVVEDPAKPGEPKAAYFDEAQKAYIDPDTHQPIPGAKPFEKPAAEHNLEKVTVNGPDGKPHVYGVNAKGEKVQDYGVAQQQPRESRGDKSADVVERETRTAIRKADSDFRNAKATADLQREFISEAKGGNKAAVKIVPLEGALEITTSQGVHRINRTEVEQYGSAGTVWDRIWGALKGKAVSGIDIPDNVLKDMDKMTQAVIDNAHKKYSDTYDDESDIAKGYGVDISKKIPKLQKEGHGNAGAAGALPPGWK